MFDILYQAHFLWRKGGNEGGKFTLTLAASEAFLPSQAQPLFVK